jgi:hypothetical protein
MSVLHQITVGLCALEHWTQLRRALGDGDVLVLLDGATTDLVGIAEWKRELGLEVRCVVPQVALSPELALPSGIDPIDDRQWWELIVAHEQLLEWN